MKNKKTILLIASLGFFAGALHGQLTGNLVVDRGLPVENLNAGSNQAWTALDPHFVADSFFLSQPTSVTGLRLWAVEVNIDQFGLGGFDFFDPNSYSLFLDPNFGSFANLGGYTPVSANAVTYQDGSLALGNQIVELEFDFSSAPLQLEGVIGFLLGGTNHSTGAVAKPHVHATYAPLAGSPQDGADNQIHHYLFPAAYGGSGEYVGTAETGWDLNIQVFSGETSMTPVPEPSTYGAIGALVLLALIAARRYRAGRA